MNIRKLIKEELESFFEENNKATSGIVGVDIVSHLGDLPETRDEVNWSMPRTYYSISDLQNPDASTEVYDKEFFTGWDRPYMRQGKAIPHSGKGYVLNFENIFGEKPIFRLNDRKIEILNPKFIAWKTKTTPQDKYSLGSLD